MKENKPKKPYNTGKEQFPTTFFDEALSEPERSKFIGCDDCKNCFLRTFFREHVTKGVLQLRRREA